MIFNDYEGLLKIVSDLNHTNEHTSFFSKACVLFQNSCDSVILLNDWKSPSALGYSCLSPVRADVQ